MTTRIIIWGAVSLATLTFSIGYGLGNYGMGILLGVVAGSLWLVGATRRWSRLNNGAFAAFVALAGYGGWLGLGPAWLLAGMISALVAWDLSHFERRLAEVPSLQEESELRRAHLRWLFIVASSGFLLGLLALSVTLPLNLVGAMLLGLLTLIGLGRMVSRTRN